MKGNEVMKAAVFKTLLFQALSRKFCFRRRRAERLRDRAQVIYMVRSRSISIYTLHKQDFKERSKAV